MSTPLAIGIYFITWWMVWFAILPFAARKQQRPEGAGGAPLWRLALYATAISAALFAVIYYVIENRLIPLD